MPYRPRHRPHLAERKHIPRDPIALPSHPLMRVCDACGSRSAEKRDHRETNDLNNRYCAVCITKRREDSSVKDGIDALIARRSGGSVHFHLRWECCFRFPAIPQETL